jgi:predicted nucleic acid-binding protein
MKVSVITNSTPIIAMAYLDQLDLLSKLFDKVYVTRQVYDEVITDSINRIGSNNNLIDNNFRISLKLYNEILNDVSEL